MRARVCVCARAFECVGACVCVCASRCLYSVTIHMHGCPCILDGCEYGDVFECIMQEAFYLDAASP